MIRIDAKESFLIWFLGADPNPGPTHSPVPLGVFRWRNDPKYTLRNKFNPLKLDPNPGPAQQATEVNIYKRRFPKYPIFQKHKELRADRVPGPTAYKAGEAKIKTLNTRPTFTMRLKTQGLAADPNPGPGKYDLSSYNPFYGPAKFTMRPRHNLCTFVPVVPLDAC